jgi:hypothetical protein
MCKVCYFEKNIQAIGENAIFFSKSFVNEKKINLNKYLLYDYTLKRINKDNQTNPVLPSKTEFVSILDHNLKEILVHSDGNQYEILQSELSGPRLSTLQQKSTPVAFESEMVVKSKSASTVSKPKSASVAESSKAKMEVDSKSASIAESSKMEVDPKSASVEELPRAKKPPKAGKKSTTLVGESSTGRELQSTTERKSKKKINPGE